MRERERGQREKRDSEKKTQREKETERKETERKRDIKITIKKRNCAKDVRCMEEKRYTEKT